MTLKMYKITESGFMATTAVIMLALGTLAFSLVTMTAAYEYADIVIRRELRIQTGLNTTACLDTVKLMAVKDYFISGTISIRDFGCTANVTNDFQGHVSISVRTNLSGVTQSITGSLTLPG